MSISEKRDVAADFVALWEDEFDIRLSESQKAFMMGYLVALLDQVERAK